MLRAIWKWMRRAFVTPPVVDGPWQDFNKRLKALLGADETD